MDTIKAIEQKLRSQANKEFRMIMTELNYFRIIESEFSTSKLEVMKDDLIALDAIASTYAPPMPLIYFDFLKLLIKDSQNKEVFDPFFGFSSPLLFQNFKSKDALVSSPVMLSVLDEYFTELKIKAEKAENFDLSTVSKKFDLVLSTLYFRDRSIDSIFTGGRGRLYSDLIINLSNKLNEEGELILVLPNKFLFDNRNKSMLNEVGINIKAVFSLPKELLFRMGSPNLNIVVLSKGKQELSFVAPLEYDTLENVILNFHNRVDSNFFETGTYADIFELKDFKSWNAKRESQRLGRRLGYASVKLADACNILQGSSLLNSDDPNAVVSEALLIHKHSWREVVLLKDIGEKNIEHFVVLGVNNEFVSASYLKNYFNTDLGQLQLEIARVSGSSLLRVDINLLNDLDLYLPSREVQNDILELDNRIENLSLELSEMRNQLWQKPKTIKAIENQINTLNIPDKLEYWIDSLPFPLSSILWRYRASNNNKERVEHLLNFFEAFAEFLVASLLSILNSDLEFYGAQKGLWLKDMYKDWHRNASFGNWKVLFQKLAKSLRFIESSESTKGSYKELFSGANEDLHKLFKSTAVGNLLESAAAYRNDWKGHGGVTSENEFRRRCILLEELLTNVRKEAKSAFDSFKIVSPSTNEYINGVYHYNVKFLLGARTPFNEAEIVSKVPLEKNSLYLILGSSLSPIRLLEFITYVESKEAIYFYSKIESKQLKWVSYHFEADSELFRPEEDAALQRMIDSLKPD